MVCEKCLLVVPDSPISRRVHANVCARVAEQRTKPTWIRRGSTADLTPAQRTGGYTS